MRVLILGYELPPIGGGTGHALANLVEEWRTLPDTEIEIWTAAAPGGMTRDLPEGIALREFSCRKKALHYWTGGEQALLLWKCWRQTLGHDSRPDVLLVWGGWPLGALLLGRLGKRIPAVVALRGSDVPGFNPRTSGSFWRLLANRVWRSAAAVTVNSPFLAALARKTAPRVEFEVIPNGVNRPRDAERTSSPFRERAADPSTPIRILSVNRLIPRKRVEILLHAVAQLPDEWRSRVQVSIVGEGPEEYRLKTLAHELDLQDRVRFLGELPGERVHGLYSESDLFVLASAAEGLSNALLEAMGHGLPCFQATPTGLEEIDSAVTPFRSSKDLAQRLLFAFRNPQRTSSLGTKARKVAQNRTWRRAAEHYDRLLRRVISS